YMDGMWDSIFSFDRGRYFKKRPQHRRFPVTVAFGAPQKPEEATVAWAHQAILDLSALAFANRTKKLREPLEIALIRALKRGPWRTMFVEHGKSIRRMKRSQVLGTAIALARRWIKYPLDEQEKRIAVLLPAGPAPAMINLGLVLIGKTPVNVPFELIDDDLAVAGFSRTLNDIGVRTVITSKVFVPRLADVWEAEEGRFIDMTKEIRAAGSVRVLLERIRAWIEPLFVTRWRLSLSENARDGEQDEAIGLVADVTRPAVFLTGLEVQKNAAQVLAGNFLNADDRVFSDLPLNKPEGVQLGLWAPLLSGKGTVINRSFQKKLTPGEIESVATAENADVIAIDHAGFEQILEDRSAWNRNAEASNPWIALFGRNYDPARVEELEKLAGMPVCRGWGSNVIGQVVAMSLPHPNVGEIRPPFEEQVGYDPKAVGRLLPGITARIDREPAQLTECGDLSLHAPLAFARKVLNPNHSEEDSENEDIPPKKPTPPLTPSENCEMRIDPVELTNQPCWIVVADRARFARNGLLFLDEEAAP
ncbi:MAG: hypothetical protein HKN23_08290, partial [Verrucomicrobiales bacterium]|nr:hypothetical protein [Verrucomicrobiales bacterium]